MSSARNYQHKHKKNNNTRHGDWICQFCQNYNYSFRVICNRCSAKPLPQNSYHEFLQSSSDVRAVQEVQYNPTNQIVDDNFPKVVFLMLGDESVDWDQYEISVRINRSDHYQSTSWIQKLIED